MNQRTLSEFMGCEVGDWGLFWEKANKMTIGRQHNSKKRVVGDVLRLRYDDCGRVMRTYRVAGKELGVSMERYRHLHGIAARMMRFYLVRSRIK